jgi:pimeloyl-ACP methyl ester carboxylesterase
MLTWTEDTVPVAGCNVHFSRGGDGPPLLLLQELSSPGWLMHHQLLAAEYTVYIPSHPGFGVTLRPEWIARINDLAVFYLWLLEELGLERVHLLGHGVGGWIAADMVTTCPQVVDRLVLVDAMGIKPQQSNILDIFLLTPQEIRAAAFYKPAQVPEWEHLYDHEPTPEAANRAEDALEMLVRLCWKPYMHDPRLPCLLPRLQRPTLVVWGREDAIVPLDCGTLYHQGITGSRLVVLEECGHYPQLEQPQAFAQTVLGFLREGRAREVA